MKKIIVGLTGASGSAYFRRLIEVLLEHEVEIHVIASEHGSQVLAYETGIILEEQIKVWNEKISDTRITLEDNNNMFSAVASGSYRCDAMIVIPCSMSTLAEIANGITKSLLTRAADVMIKEQRKLVIVPRETPLSTIHLKNMYELSKVGVTILPAMPGFYNLPETVDDMINHIVGKALDCIGIDNNNYKRWKGKN
ncbi:UbiX family flavin prenyltransferase [Anaerosporobacter sp.]